jgi:hypothetical protein
MERNSKFLDWYECELGKFDPLILWSAVLEESGGEVNMFLDTINRLLSIENKTPEQEVELSLTVSRCGQIAKAAFAQQVSEPAALDDKPLYFYYVQLVEFFRWLSKKD